MGFMSPVAMAVGSVGLSTYSQNRQLEEQARAQRRTAQNYWRSMNYTLQNLERTRQDAFEATIDEMENVKLQGNRLASAVDNAVYEGLQGGGRTAKLLMRNARADTARTVTSLKSNYEKKRNEIDLNKEATSLETKNILSSMPKIQKPSLFSTLVNFGAAYFGGLQTAEAIKLIQTKAGVARGASGGNTSTMGNPGAIAALSGGSYSPITSGQALGNYGRNYTYYGLFGGNYKTGSFFNSTNWRG